MSVLSHSSSSETGPSSGSFTLESISRRALQDSQLQRKSFQDQILIGPAYLSKGTATLHGNESLRRNPSSVARLKSTGEDTTADSR